MYTTLTILGEGCVVQVHPGSQAQQGAVNLLDLSEKTRAALLTYNIGRMVTIQAEREVSKCC